MNTQPITVFIDRDGDTLSVTPRDTSEFGNAIPDPVITVTHSVGSPYENAQSVVFEDDQARQIIHDLALNLLGEEWGPKA